MMNDRNAPTSDIDRRPTLTVYMGTRSELKARVYKLEHDRKSGYNPTGIVVNCQHRGCDKFTFIDDSVDLVRFERGELFCSDCRERDFYALPHQEREQRRNFVASFVSKFLSAIRALSDAPMRALLRDLERFSTKDDSDNLTQDEMPY